MIADAIVYKSNTGHTRRYAELLAKKINLPAYDLNEAVKLLSRGSSIIYLGWVRAGKIQGYKKAANQYHVVLVCSVGINDDILASENIRKATAISETIPIFNLKGGINRSMLKGINKFIITMLEKGLSSAQNKSDADAKMLELLKSTADFVSEENLEPVINQYLD